MGWAAWSGFLNWWDSVELWLSGRDFVAQTAVVMPVVLGVAYVLAVSMDALLGRGIGLMHRARHDFPDDFPGDFPDDRAR